MKASVLTAALTAAAICAAPAFAQEKKTVLSLDTAKKMAAACVKLATEQGWKMNIAILDDGGNLKYFERMDGAYRGSIEIAQLKANTSTMFPMSTKQVGDITQRVPGIVYVPGVVTFEGGLPIMTGAGEHIGAIGVSGARSEQDGMCAQAGVDAVKDLLK
ncbi:MAG: heme-binding protein [Betaproteobacteria bacterium]|nr:heme-binding protein [Betaproteobacteria bacterium]